MGDGTTSASGQERTSASWGLLTKILTTRFLHAFENTSAPFEIHLPDRSVHRFGRAAPCFRIILKNRNAVRAMATLDEGRFADAYLAGDIDLEGDMLRPFELRSAMGSLHVLASAWRFVQPLVFGQLDTNCKAISSHYDIAPEFFLSFLDPKMPCYTQGVYESDNEPLHVATLRKFEYCFDRLKLKPGDHILEIGPGWGAWLDYASSRGIKCTAITISQVSVDYLKERAKKLGHDWKIIFSDFLSYVPDRKYDAIVIMGVIEHLPQYDRVVRQLMSCLKPGGNVFLDGSANIKKYQLCSFMVKYIYPANHSFLILHEFLEQLAKTPMRITELFNDRQSYFLTFRQWATNFDNHRDAVIERFGEFNYRRFRLYLWGATFEFLSRSLDCYRLVIHYAE